MGTQLKPSTSLNDEQQAQLAELLAEEPLANRSMLLSLGLRAIYALWKRAGRDLKAALGLLRVIEAGGAA